MPAPPITKSIESPKESKTLSQVQHVIDLTDDDDDDKDFMQSKPIYSGRPGKKLKLK